MTYWVMPFAGDRLLLSNKADKQICQRKSVRHEVPTVLLNLNARMRLITPRASVGVVALVVTFCAVDAVGFDAERWARFVGVFFG